MICARPLTLASIAVVFAVACGRGGGDEQAVPAGRSAATPIDAQHQNITGPHGDHAPHHGGMVLMNGDVHYEVVLAKDGRHEIWFSDAVRNDLPASVATGVTMEIARPGAAVEVVKLAIDDTGEAWVIHARPIEGEGVMVTIRYALQGEPHEIEIPVVPATIR